MLEIQTQLFVYNNQKNNRFFGPLDGAKCATCGKTKMWHFPDFTEQTCVYLKTNIVNNI